MDEVDTRRAIQAAKKAFAGWSKTTGKARYELLMKWYDLSMQNIDDLATILSAECGKPLAEAKGEIVYGSSFLQWFAEEAKRVYGDVIPPNVPGRRIVVVRQPVGVCGLITPFNFPNSMLTRKAGAALAAGGTIIAKPAPETPLSTLSLCELAIRAGIPPGVVNAIVSNHDTAPKIGTELCTNPDVAKISFTGSTAVGKLLIQQSASTCKRVSMELGGNAPFIVFDDADVDSAVLGAMQSKFRNTGQTCVCTNRFFIQSAVYDEFLEKITDKVKKLKVGEPFEAGVEQGPLIHARALEKVERHLTDAVSKGAKIATGGKKHARGGNFFEPTVLSGMTREMQIFSEETFGPIAALYKFDTEEDVIRMANDTEFGLAAYFYSRDIGRVWRVGEALEYGMVGINCGLISTEVAPFGGVKSSGFGREGSKYGIEEYTFVKTMTMGIE
jgi:succinate-semialdehyde dehydrogenase/glutarate-semialdehyde dehydrogenase